MSSILAGRAFLRVLLAYVRLPSLSQLFVRSLSAVLWAAMLLPARGADDVSILRRLTPQQQAQIERGAQQLARTGDMPGVAAMAIPALAMSDASSAVASPEVLAASWDAGAAHAYGEALAAQALAGGTNVVGVPVDTLGEDPVLAAHLAAPLVRGLQDAHAIAALFGGASGSSDERAMYELQWPAIESAVVNGKAGAVTCALRDGRVASLCSNRAIVRMLSREVRFDGFGIAMPTGDLSGVSRVLTAMRRAHLMGGSSGRVEVRYDPVSRRLVESGSVLLKNDAGVLPLDPRTVRSLAVFGADPELMAALRDTFPQTRIATTGLDDPVAAARAAQGQAVCLILLGAHAAPGEEAAVSAIAAANPRTAVVLERSITSAPAWSGAAPAILLTWAPVLGTPAAVADLIAGSASPSGHLPITLAFPSDPLPAPQGLRRGYRAFGAGAASTAFSFGSGLTYTTFVYSNFKVAYGHRPIVAPVTVSFVVRNAGARSGTVVPQLYLKFPPQSQEPSKLLTDFVRVTLAPGGQRSITMPLGARSFAYWSERHKAWFVAPGTYQATIGSSVADVALSGDIRIVAKR